MHSIVEKCHLDFRRTGSQVITTGHYAVTPINNVFSKKEMARLVSIAGKLVQNAVKRFIRECPSSERPLIAGCLPPLTESYRPDLVAPFDQNMKCYRRIIRNLEPYVDIYLAETFSTPQDALCAIHAVGAESDKPM